jgi:hypothetical protein
MRASITMRLLWLLLYDTFVLLTWTLQKVDQKYLGSFEMRRWKRMEKISWTENARSEVLHNHLGEEYPTHNKKNAI